MTKKKQYDPSKAHHAPINDDVAFLLAGTPDETVQRARERKLPLLHLPTATIAPDPQQLRRLPHPNDLHARADQGDRSSIAMLAKLRELGQSIQQHGQLQPVVVYAARDPANPVITHQLLHGQRRWSGAVLVGLPTLWAVEVPPPANTVRLFHQYEENERREGFVDMERAWALVALKEALQRETGAEVPWGRIEEQVHLSAARRQDLLRLLRFSPAGQELILQQGWSEWTLRPLHMALNAGLLDQDEATHVLQQLAAGPEATQAHVESIITSQYASAASRAAHERTAAPGVGDDALRATSTTASVYADLLRRMGRLHRSLDQLSNRLAAVTDDATRKALVEQLDELLARLQLLRNTIVSSDGQPTAASASVQE